MLQRDWGETLASPAGPSGPAPDAFFFPGPGGPRVHPLPRRIRKCRADWHHPLLRARGVRDPGDHMEGQEPRDPSRSQPSQSQSCSSLGCGSGVLIRAPLASLVCALVRGPAPARCERAPAVADSPGCWGLRGRVLLSLRPIVQYTNRSLPLLMRSSFAVDGLSDHRSASRLGSSASFSSRISMVCSDT